MSPINGFVPNFGTIHVLVPAIRKCYEQRIIYSGQYHIGKHLVWLEYYSMILSKTA